MDNQFAYAARGTTALAGPSAVTLRWAPLDLLPTERAALGCNLSPEERDRAADFARPRERNRFIAARGWLRRLLGAELDCPPAEVDIVAAARGKPEVAGSDVRFSAARSRGLALFAIARGADVGVDVEAIRPGADLDRITALFFSPSERRRLAALPAAERLRATYQSWTCKEAYVKGTGAGLDDAVRSVDTWTGTGEAARVDDWSIREIVLAPGFAAAVAIQPGACAVTQVQGTRIG